MKNTALIFVAFYIILITGRYGGADAKSVAGPDSGCLECLCQASTGCQSIGCYNAGPGKYYCGPFQISYPYWVDAGKPGADPSNPIDFELCLNDRRCAEETVIGYMRRYRWDCDRNNRIDCYDYARIHNVGPYGCNGTFVTTTDFWKQFTKCY